MAVTVPRYPWGVYDDEQRALVDRTGDGEGTLAGQLRTLVELYGRRGDTAAQAAERARAVVERAFKRV